MLNLDKRALELPQLILASGSPRRAEILTSVGWPFQVRIPDVDETENAGESPDEYVMRLAQQKAAAIAQVSQEGLILAADTTVVIEGQILGKPVDREDAVRMIKTLSGATHQVLTGVAIIKNGICRTGLQKTSVTFRKMTEDEVHFLVDNGDPYDKAGGYAVQAQAALFIEGIEGDYWNVVGLPISLVYALVHELCRDIGRTA